MPADGRRRENLPRLVRAFRRWAETVQAEPAHVAGATKAEQEVLGALGGIAAALGGRHIDGWPEEVKKWALAAPTPPDELASAVRDLLGAGGDPLAVLYDASISSANRRRLGTVFTPEPVVAHMLQLVSKRLDRPPACVIDPGAGSGAFTIAAARRWPTARVLAVDVNVVTLGLLASRIGAEIDIDPENAERMQNVQLVHGDYLDQLDGVYDGAAPTPVAAIGNPPYTRAQELPQSTRQKAAAAASGVIDSGHANLAMLFLAATVKRMRARDVCCMVVPGSLSYTRASRGLRRMLWEAPRSVEVQRASSTSRTFKGRSVQAAIVVIGSTVTRRPPMRLARVELQNPAIGVKESWTLKRSAEEPDNWYWPEALAAPDADSVQLCDVATVRRGVATGAKEMFFLADDTAAALPTDVITAGMPSLRGFEADDLTRIAHRRYGDATTGRWLLVIPPDYRLTGALLEYVERWKADVAHRFLLSQRTPWYSLTGLIRPHLLISPLAKTRFKVVRNSVGAVPSNNLFGITPNLDATAGCLMSWLCSPAGQAELRRVSRRYHGGSHKVEPRGLRSVRIPKSALVAE